MYDHEFDGKDADDLIAKSKNVGLKRGEGIKFFCGNGRYIHTERERERERERENEQRERER